METRAAISDGMSDHQQAACLSIPTGDAIADSIAIKYQLSTGLFQPRNDLEQVRHNSPSSNEFGKGLVCDVDANDIAEYRRKRLAAGVANRTENYETGALRGNLRQYGLWGPIADRVKALPERHDVGRAISVQDETKILAAASQSRSPALLSLIVLSIDSGMRLVKRRPSVSEQTIKAFAGHVSRQMLERYSHIRSQAKQAAIQALEQSAVEPILNAAGHKIGHIQESAGAGVDANSKKTKSGPGRIRTYDQRIMSPLL